MKTLKALFGRERSTTAKSIDQKAQEISSPTTEKHTEGNVVSLHAFPKHAMGAEQNRDPEIMTVDPDSGDCNFFDGSSISGKQVDELTRYFIEERIIPDAIADINLARN